MKKFLLMILATIFIAFNANAFDEINGNKIVLLTAAERKATNKTGEYESITQQRAENACKLLGKSLKTFTYKEIEQDSFYSTCEPRAVAKWGCITSDEIKNKYKIPTSTTLLPVEEYNMETHYHRGGATVAVLTLGFIPIIIPYKARIATSIKCQDIGEMSFTTN
jgi:hypothetical protein